jgi:N-acetylneuraminic acid mutarotase
MLRSITILHIGWMVAGMLGWLSVTEAAAQGWTLHTIPTARENAAVVALDGRIYVIGGYNNTALKLVERYDPAQDLWETIEALPDRRTEAAAAVFEGKIYLMGGRDDAGRVKDDVFVYDPNAPESSRWQEIGSLEEKRASAAAVMFQDRLYVLGGVDDRERLRKTVEYFDPQTNDWELDTNWTLDLEHAAFGAVNVNGVVYVVGGNTSSGFSSQIQRYGAVPTLPGLPQPFARAGLGVATIENRFYAIGGHPASLQPSDSVNVYDVTTDAWTALASLTIPRTTFGAAVLNRTLYVVGGRSGSRPEASMEVFKLNTLPIASPDALTTNEDTPKSLDLLLNDTDPDGDPLTIALTVSPLHGEFRQVVSGIYSYTPDEHFFGMDSLRYELRDGQGGTSEAWVTITVNPVNDAPVFTSVPVTAATEGISYAYAAQAADVEGGILSFTASGLPQGLGAVPAPGNLLVIGGIPATGTTGAYPITLTVSDGAATATQSFTLQVEGVLQAPTAPNLVAPVHGTQDLPVPVTLEWTPIAASTTYDLQLARTADFASPVLDTTGLVQPRLTLGVLQPLQDHYWRVRAVNAAGSSPWSTAFSFRTAKGTDTEPTEALRTFTLEQNHPNPFRGQTRLVFHLEAASSTPVRLAVYDVQGRLVRLLVESILAPGRHELVWDGLDAAGQPLASGVYLGHLQQGQRIQSRPMIYLR